MFIPRSVPSSTATMTRPVPVAIIAVVLTTLLLALAMLALFVWRSRRAECADAEAHPHPTEKQKKSTPPPQPRSAMRPLELSQVPRAYTPFSSLPPRWSPRNANTPAPVVYSYTDEKATLPLYSARPAPPPVRPSLPRRYSSRVGRRERELSPQGFERLDLDGRERERVMDKLNGLMAKMRVEFKETL